MQRTASIPQSAGQPGSPVCGVDATVPAPPACCAAMMLKPAVTCPFS